MNTSNISNGFIQMSKIASTSLPILAAKQGGSSHAKNILGKVVDKAKDVGKSYAKGVKRDFDTMRGHIGAEAYNKDGSKLVTPIKDRLKGGASLTAKTVLPLGVAAAGATKALSGKKEDKETN